ncbi:hypothetical protein NDU88_003346 [Pleurodeles waltl]|uniref:Uncharacterized protein n=1 Tax=Pleurodeles waltl TaxID=8319 RepID=A0AAV7UCA2_PLEWA|nr:hypothetical protein NDU88_003346 [Pleurodeles waltl]
MAAVRRCEAALGLALASRLHHGSSLVLDAPAADCGGCSPPLLHAPGSREGLKFGGRSHVEPLAGGGFAGPGRQGSRRLLLPRIAYFGLPAGLGIWGALLLP